MSKTSAVAARALTSSHFELFGLVPAFALDIARLEAAYRDIQAAVHPDRFAHAGDAERRASMQMTTQVNEAYRILKSPLRRASYLLELNGVDTGFETNTAMSPEFLVQQMEMREKLDEAKKASELAILSQGLAVEKHEIEKKILEEIDGKRDFAAASELVRKLMFLDRFGDEIDSACERLDG